MKDSITRTAIKNSLNLVLIELLTDIIQRGVINVVNKMNNTEKSSLPISSAFSFSAGLLKELNDKKGKNGYFSIKDMVANIGGIMLGAIIINQ